MQLKMDMHCFNKPLRVGVAGNSAVSYPNSFYGNLSLVSLF